MPGLRYMFVLYVEDASASARFYAGILGRPVAEQSPVFAALALEDGTMLGLWSRHAAEPKAAGAPGSGEIAIALADAAAVHATHDAWRARGLAIAQAPVRMGFGPSFVALDPDGHRLRVFAREAA